MLVDQMISRIEYVHTCHLIHRDIKPDNFLMGIKSTGNIVYIIDFGLSKRYRDPESLVHIPWKSNKSLTGTARYASINAHKGTEQSRRDDLEAISYVFMYFITGTLPWQGLQATAKKAKFERIAEMKMKITPEQLLKDGPVPWASDNQVTFIAEQTSHHPPIASFYAECPAKHIQIDGCLWTRSKFLGLSVGVHMIGDAIITLLDHDEQYVITFPSAFGRSILGVPWFEMGGKITITCEKTGYTANIDFLQKPFLNGKKHQITGILYGPDKKEFCRIDGEWNGIMNAKYSDTKISEVFFDTKATPVIKKIVRPIIDQDTNESRRMWKDVTYYLKSKQLDKATGAKSFLEHRQRTEAKERHENSLKWETKHFSESGELKWTYANKLSKRLNSQS
ncbi:unnamed protein product [Adineta steineri]|uniref:Protein kinase domain-containing protein n=1 Tax=Adineta steineri TaxID=433720 RepID=A0A813ZUM9_9BILA|nr:unnamed protein product [Adineta steineri]